MHLDSEIDASYLKIQQTSNIEGSIVRGSLVGSSPESVFHRAVQHSPVFKLMQYLIEDHELYKMCCCQQHKKREGQEPKATKVGYYAHECDPE